VLPLIHRDLQLDEKGVAALSGLPVLLLGLAAVPGSVLIARVGARRALLTGLWLIGLSSAVRGLGSSTIVLFGATLAMGAGIAISQPTFPALVRQWFPENVTRATGVWSNGLLVGELLGAALTLPLVLPLVNGWQASFVFWAVPVLITAVLVSLGTPHLATEAGLWRGAGLPNWRTPLMWQLGVMQSAASLVYFGANTFIPDYLQTTGQASLIPAALTALNGAQLPASAVIGLVPLRILGKRVTSFSVGGLILAAMIVAVALPGWPIVLAAGAFGFCAAYILVLSLALPALLAPAAQVARLSAGTFSISYTLAFLATLAAGAAWDATHVETAAFLPVLVGGAVVSTLGPRLVGASIRSG
jgi:CP family cyanate transporter-like MFS transporter